MFYLAAKFRIDFLQLNFIFTHLNIGFDIYICNLTFSKNVEFKKQNKKLTSILHSESKLNKENVFSFHKCDILHFILHFCPVKT